MLNVIEGSDPNWVGKYWGDGMDFNGESGSPIITQAMIDEASSDPFNRLTVNGITLWYVTSDKLGWEYKDGIDTTAICSKAKGSKCSICWKIKETACDRANCAIE